MAAIRVGHWTALPSKPCSRPSRPSRIDVIVVYKVDRLTRSLADFAKLVELFDGHGVSFVSVTQAFNTTTSMGRLTLNVLLSFAQFEREVTGERIRDKIAASKRKGIWVGGMVPLGYDCIDSKIVLNPEEAERVRLIFSRYLALQSLGKLLEELRAKGIVTKRRELSTGRTIGAVPFGRGALAYLLRNRCYIGEIVYRGEICPSSYPPILERDLFEAVQAKLRDQDTGYRQTRLNSEALLLGRIHDDAGHRMTPTHSRKKGLRYRYYVSSALAQGQAKAAGSLAKSVGPGHRSAGPLGAATASAAGCRSSRTVTSSSPTASASQSPKAASRSNCSMTPTRIPSPSSPSPGAPASSTRRREILGPTTPQAKPAETDTRERILRAMAMGRRWLQELIDGPVTSVEEIARREKRSERNVAMMLSFAFLAPDLTQGSASRSIASWHRCPPAHRPARRVVAAAPALGARLKLSQRHASLRRRRATGKDQHRNRF